MSEELTLGKQISEARKRAVWTQNDVAKALEVTPQAVSQWERDLTVPEGQKLVALSRLLNVNFASPLGEAVRDYERKHVDLQNAMASAREQIRREAENGYIPGDQLVGARDFPIYAAAEAGAGFMIVHTDVMEYVKRPVILEGVPDSYGVLVKGDSMIPAYRPGNMALVHPRLPMERETDVILYDHDHRTGDAKAMIKRLLGFNDRSLKLEQYNPAKTFSEHRADWPICHQVVGMYKGR